ncbi:MAG: nuclear transport factor 2 family protein [Candidatus Wallbacteria bacterium]|nr:nuclear transport factor 2 family protein [Candidatus Wallbacteria bacterium]
MRRRAFVFPAGLAFLVAVSSTALAATPRDEVHRAVSAWHRAAAKADEEAYFALFAADAVFLGSDATERWTRDSFRKWAHPYFARGKAWTLIPTERHVALSADATVAWFDELLHSPAYGQCRGSGVVVLQGGGWRIAQYNFSIPIPNALADSVVKQIRGR